MARREIPFAGVLVPDARIRTAGAASTIVESGTTTTSYQQAGPTAPGAVDLGSDVVVGLSGEQAASVYLDIGRGGAPDPARGARLRWADSSTDTLLGWAPPTWLQYSTGTTDLNGSDAFDMIALADGSVMAVCANGSTTECATYVPTTDTWTARADLPWQATAATPSEALLALWQDPDDAAVYALQTDVAGGPSTRRMLVRTTDSGASWSTVAQASFTGGTITADVRDARWFQLPSGTHVLVLIGGSTVQTWQSSSGEDWQLVGSIGSIFVGPSGLRAAADVVLLPDGRLVYAYILSASRTIMRVRLCDALADPATAVELSAVTVSNNLNQISLALEETGRLWALADETTLGGRVFRSLDYSTWLEDAGERWVGAGSMELDTTTRKCLQVDGGHLLATGVPNGTAETAPPVLYHLGGWTSFEPWSVATGLSARDSDRLTWGASNTATVPWLGLICSQRLADPTAFGWNRLGSGSGEVQTAAHRQISTSSANRYYVTNLTTYKDSALCFFDVACTVGGSLTATQVGVQLQTNLSASAGLHIAVRCSTAGFRVAYVGGATLTTVTVDMTTPMQFMIATEAGNRLEVYYRRPGVAAWTSAAQVTSPTTAGTANASVSWGHIISSTSTSQWRGVWYAASTSTRSATAKRDQWRSTGSTVAKRQQVLGRPLATLPGSLGSAASYPAVNLLSVVPTTGTTGTVEPAHAYPVDHLDPVASPSPRQVWRSTGATEQILEWHLDPSLQSADLTYYALYLGGANFRQAVLEYFDGSWQTWATVDLGESVTFSRTGNTIEATSGSPRWLQQHEAVGGYVDLGSSILRRIDWNSTGYGSADGTRSRIRMTGAAGTDPSNGTATLVHTRGVAASLQQVTARRIRLRIPAQSTPEGYFELGVAAIGRVYALGSPVDFGSGQSTLIDVREDQAPGYMTRARRSPPRRRWSLAIAESNLSGIRDGVAGYLAADGAPTIGVGIEGDVAPLLEGLLAQGIDASPVLVLPAPPETEDGSTDHTTTETRRDVLWWGRVSSVQWDNVVGELGASELQRISTVTIEEDV